MAERPILFNASMVRAIMTGTKTQTRRIAKPIRHPDFGNVYTPGALILEHEPQHVIERACPYGQPGDRLWIREAWRIGAWNEEDQQIAVDYIDGPDKSWRQVPLTPEGQELFDRLWMQSSDECRSNGVRPDIDGNYRWAPGESPLRWRPSIHMPLWASRITLEITGVRVERLQDISESDAVAEGVFRKVGATSYGDAVETVTGGQLIYADPSQAREEFRRLWEHINGPESWAANPWVWVLDFKRA